MHGADKGNKLRAWCWCWCSQRAESS